MIASVYIHIPFCNGICDYCDFFSVPVDEKKDAALLDSFIDAVLDDIKNQIDLFCVDEVPSVYIGGGTPSVLGMGRIERLLTGITALLNHISEFTIEANPESSDRGFLQSCAKGGVSRLCLGIQTFHEPSRRAVHRAGAASLLEQRLALAAEYFPGAFSADLITGLPLQTKGVLREDIKRLLVFQPVHVSLYSLTFEPQTPLGKKISQYTEAALSLPCGDEADSLWLCGRDELEKSGFTQYEVSNFALAGKACAHNIRYWRMENWLGVGPAASGTIIDDATGSGRRFTYPQDIKGYLAAPSPRINHANVEELDRETLIKESLLMGFRYCEGPDPLLFMRRFGRSIEDCIPKTISRWKGRDFFADHNSTAPSTRGLLFLNVFLRDAFDELTHNGK
jgi:oxygen-independent coproporphyrinogen-3 oxidase